MFSKPLDASWRRQLAGSRRVSTTPPGRRSGPRRRWRLTAVAAAFLLVWVAHQQALYLANTNSVRANTLSQHTGRWATWVVAGLNQQAGRKHQPDVKFGAFRPYLGRHPRRHAGLRRALRRDAGLCAGKATEEPQQSTLLDGGYPASQSPKKRTRTQNHGQNDSRAK